MPDQVRELGNVGAEQPELVHGLQRAVDARRRGQDLAEQRARLGVGAERVVDPVQVLAHQPLRARARARRRGAARRRRPRAGARAAPRSATPRGSRAARPLIAKPSATGCVQLRARGQPRGASCARVVDHAPRHALDRARVQVVGAHQLLDAAQRVARRESRGTRRAAPAPRSAAGRPCARRGAAGCARATGSRAPTSSSRCSSSSMKPCTRSCSARRTSQMRGARDPERGVEVAQAADALLQVRLQQVERLAEALVALGLLGELARR